ncbi:MAG: OmcA/MtrC family decaheme c-type cytochrome [Kofleriaceae bacterium]
MDSEWHGPWNEADPMRFLIAAFAFALVACEGPAGPQGATGATGDSGSAGETGSQGSNGSDATGPWLTRAPIQIAITDLAFANSAATVSFTLTDDKGVPLDVNGRLTDGTIATSFVLAQLGVEDDGSPAQYTAYTTKQVTSGSNVATQVMPESSGTLKTVDVTAGTYTYTFQAPLTGFAAARTQTVAALAVRTPSSGGEAIGNATFSIVPAGGVPAVREEVQDGTCNNCHRGLEMHGNRWTSTAQCILCHQPQASDPVTGNTLDFKVMVHRIHQGNALPSVIAGTPYQIAGYMGVMSDFSTVGFPETAPVSTAGSSGIVASGTQRCTACHAGALGDRWKTEPAREACTSCHDNISFSQPVPTGKVLHGGGTQPDNAPCGVCHAPTGSIAGVTDVHFIGLLSANRPTVELAIQTITNTGPGQTPTLTFTASVNGAPANLVSTPLTSLTATIAGPNTDITSEWQARIQGTGAVGTLTLVDAATGLHSYAFPASAAIPPAATGSYTVGLEGFTQPVSTGPRYAAINPVLAFAVTDSAAQPRRQIVALASCNKCHNQLSAHGGSRTNPNYCVLCHSPGGYDSAGAPRFQGTSNVVAEALDFRHMLHKVHAGEQLSQSYGMGGFPLPSTTNPAGTHVDFSDIRYPAPLTSCAACHTSTNWTLPLANSTAYAPTVTGYMSCDPAGGSNAAAYCASPYWTVTSTTQQPVTTSACTSCHDAPYTLAHAQLNTTPVGVEACATCHGSGMAYDVQAFHGTP